MDVIVGIDIGILRQMARVCAIGADRAGIYPQVAGVMDDAGVKKGDRAAFAKEMGELCRLLGEP